MFEPNVFFDRYGRQKFNDDIVPSHKKGYFVLLVKDDWVLLTIPPKQKVPEFPGGSILRGEDFHDCLFRKLYEETGLELMLGRGDQTFEQTVPYFADDEPPCGMFYIYEQVFYAYNLEKYDVYIKSEPWSTPERGFARWVKIKDIFEGKVKINYAHWQALQQMIS